MNSSKKGSTATSVDDKAAIAELYLQSVFIRLNSCVTFPCLVGMDATLSGCGMPREFGAVFAGGLVLTLRRSLPVSFVAPKVHGKQHLHHKYQLQKAPLRPNARKTEDCCKNCVLQQSYRDFIPQVKCCEWIRSRFALLLPLWSGRSQFFPEGCHRYRAPCLR